MGCLNEHVDVEDINEQDEATTEEVESDSGISSGSVIEETNYETNTHDSTQNVGIRHNDSANYDKDNNDKPVEGRTQDEIKEGIESFQVMF